MKLILIKLQESNKKARKLRIAEKLKEGWENFNRV